MTLLIFCKKLEKSALKETGWQTLDCSIYPEVITVLLTAPRARTQQLSPKPRYLYHVTSAKNERQILRRGLIPRAGPSDRPSLSYKSRIYFLVLDFSVDDFSDLLDYNTVVGGISRIEEVVIFELDTRKFNRFNLFLDKEMSISFPIKAAVWTPTHIPPKALEVVYRASEDER